MYKKISLIIAVIFCANLGLQASEDGSSEEMLRNMAPVDWEKSESWVYDFRNTMGSQASLAWINEVIADGASMYWHQDHKGLIIIGTEANDDDLSAVEFSQSASFDGTLMGMVPAGEAKAIDYGAVSEWRGTMEGQQVVMQRICLFSPVQDEFMTITSIVPLKDFQNSSHPAIETSFAVASQFSEQHGMLIGMAD